MDGIDLYGLGLIGGQRDNELIVFGVNGDDAVVIGTRPDFDGDADECVSEHGSNKKRTYNPLNSDLITIMSK